MLYSQEEAQTTGFRVAWGMALAPVFLFLPAFWLAGMGPCAFGHPSLMLVAAILFAGLELSAFRAFVPSFRLSFSPVAGSGVAALLFIAAAWLYYVLVFDYM